VFSSLSSWLHKISRTWVALLGLAIFTSFLLWVLPAQASAADGVREGVGSPDMSFLYVPESLYRIAEAYGLEGRAAYIRERFTFDLVWPVVYTFFLATALSWIFSRAFQPDSGWQIANVLPVMAGGLDYLENLTASYVLWRYPVRAPIASWLAPLFTLGKWIAIGGRNMVYSPWSRRSLAFPRVNSLAKK